MTGPVAQRLVQETHNLLVLGSNPSRPTNYSDIDDNIIDVEFEEILRPDPNLIKIYKMVENIHKPSYIGRRVNVII